VPDGILSFRIGPPRRSLDIAFGVGVVGLLLGLDEFNKGLPHYLTRGLLHVFEADKVESFDLGFVPDDQLLGLLDGDGGVVTVSIPTLVEGRTGSFPLPTRGGVVLVRLVRPGVSLELPPAPPARRRVSAARRFPLDIGIELAVQTILAAC
jgi:hypothetical protein